MIATARKLENIRDLKEAGASIRELDVTWEAGQIKTFAKEIIDSLSVAHLVSVPVTPG